MQRPKMTKKTKIPKDDPLAAALAPLTAVEPPKSLRARVLDRVCPVVPAEPIPDGLAALVRTAAMPWKPSPFPGVSVKRLFQDPAGNISWIVKLDPGATYPRHRHSTCEHCLVLEGEVQFDSYVLRAGDYEVANPDTDHSSFVSPAGAVLFIIANKHDELLMA
jgi:anti-sigma factor ChrR (cupin superfamily)